MSEQSSTPDATIRELYVQVLGPGCMEDPATVEVVPHFFADYVEVMQMSSMLGTAKRFPGHRGVLGVGGRGRPRIRRRGSSSTR